jgi:predicted nucleotidyltransferase
MIQYYSGMIETPHLTVVRWPDKLYMLNVHGKYALIWQWSLFKVYDQCHVPVPHHKVAVVDDYGTLVIVGDVQY